MDAKETSAARVISHLKLFIKMFPGTKKPSLGKVCFQHVVPYHTEEEGGAGRENCFDCSPNIWLYYSEAASSGLHFFYLLLQKSKDPRTFRGSDLELTFLFHCNLFTPITHSITHIRENSNTYEFISTAFQTAAAGMSCSN